MPPMTIAPILPNTVVMILNSSARITRVGGSPLWCLQRLSFVPNYFILNLTTDEQTFNRPLCIQRLLTTDVRFQYVGLTIGDVCKVRRLMFLPTTCAHIIQCLCNCNVKQILGHMKFSGRHWKLLCNALVALICICIHTQKVVQIC